MRTRNRGKSTSIVEILGLARRVKRGTKDQSSSPPKKKSRKTLKLDNLESLMSEETEDTISCKVSPNYFPEADLSPINILPDTKSKPFKLTDKATQQMLREISTSGRLFMSREKYKQHLHRTGDDENPDNQSAVNYKFIINEPSAMELCTALTNTLGEINMELDKKDAFLASSGLLRQKMKTLLRQRREKLATERQLRRVRSYLRPNPRRTRYASALGTSVRRRRINIDRNTRVAAKKLAQAKSRATGGVTSNRGRRGVNNTGTEGKRGRPRKTHSLNYNKPSTVTNTVSSIQTRHKQSINMSKHIDWKYCYSAMENSERSAKTETVASRKRRAAAAVRMPKEENDASDHDFELDVIPPKVEEESHHQVDLDESGSEEGVDAGGLMEGSYRRTLPEERHLKVKSKASTPKRGAFATPRLLGPSSESEPRPKAGRKPTNTQLSVVERLVLGLTDVHVTMNDKSGEVTVKVSNEKEMHMLLERAENAHFETPCILLNGEDSEMKYTVVLSIPSAKISGSAAVSNEARLQRESENNLEKPSMLPGESMKGKEEELSVDLSNFEYDMDWPIDYSRRKTSTQQRFQSPLSSSRFRAPKFNRVRSVKPSPLSKSSSSGRQLGSRDEEESAAASMPHLTAPPFRRHRMFVRKIYTGNATVPKILNRRQINSRPQGGAVNSVGVSRSVANVAPEASVFQPPIISSQPYISHTPAPQPVALQVDIQPPSSVPGSVVENAGSSSIPSEAVSEGNPLSSEVTNNDKKGVPIASSPQVPEIVDSFSNTSAENLNPASSMSASQLLRLKRTKDENQQQQHQRQQVYPPPIKAVPSTTNTVIVNLADTITSVAFNAQAVQVTAPVEQQQQSQLRIQRKLNLAHSMRVESGGNRNFSVDLDDGADFELSTKILPPLPLSASSGPKPLMSVAPSQTLPIQKSLTSVVNFLPVSTHKVSPRPSTIIPSQNMPVSSVLPPKISLVRPPVSVQPSRNVSVGIREGNSLTGRPLVSAGFGKTGVSTITSSQSTPKVNSENRRQLTHKVHSLRRISPKRSLPAPLEDNGTAAPVASMPFRSSSGSQLLKSLLQNGAQNTNGGGKHMVSSPQTQLQNRLNSPGALTSMMHASSESLKVPPGAGPTHQSRGTWQVGGRAIVVGASVIKHPASSPISQSLPVANASPKDSTGESS